MLLLLLMVYAAYTMTKQKSRQEYILYATGLCALYALFSCFIRGEIDGASDAVELTVFGALVGAFCSAAHIGVQKYILKKKPEVKAVDADKTQE